MLTAKKTNSIAGSVFGILLTVVLMVTTQLALPMAPELQSVTTVT